MSVGLQPSKLTHLGASCWSCSSRVVLSPVGVCVCVYVCVSMHAVKFPQQWCSDVFTPSIETLHHGCNQSWRVPHNNSIPPLWFQWITFSSCVCDYSILLVSIAAAGCIWIQAKRCVYIYIFMHIKTVRSFLQSSKWWSFFSVLIIGMRNRRIFFFFKQCVTSYRYV